jgi:hypothetical protein
MLPTAGACPPGRYSALVEVNFANRAAFAVTWSWNVWSTTKPRSATLIAGWSSRATGLEPKRLATACQVAGVPGTPTESPLVIAVAEGYGWSVAGSMKMSGRNAAGPVSRPSTVETRWVRAS